MCAMIEKLRIFFSSAMVGVAQRAITEKGRKAIHMNLIELETEGMSFGSAAVGRFTPEGETRAMVVFVEGAAPGERVRVELLRSHKSYWEGRVVEVLRPSPDRVSAPCEVFGRCGGCQWQHLSYEAQMAAKAK